MLLLICLTCSAALIILFWSSDLIVLRVSIVEALVPSALAIDSRVSALVFSALAAFFYLGVLSAAFLSVFLVSIPLVIGPPRVDSPVRERQQLYQSSAEVDAP